MRAKRAAERHNELMGDWIGRAIDMLAEAEARANGKVLPPPKPQATPRANPWDSLTPDAAGSTLQQLCAVMQQISAIAEATGHKPPKRMVGRLYRLSEEWARWHVQRGLTAGKTTTADGKTWALPHDFFATSKDDPNGVEETLVSQEDGNPAADGRGHCLFDLENTEDFSLPPEDHSGEGTRSD